MKRLIVALLGTALLAGSGPLLTGCAPARSGTVGAAPTGVPPSGPTSTDSASPSTPPDASASAGPNATPTATITIEVWFVRAGQLFLTHRTRPATLATSRLALTELIAGPSTVEAVAGVGNAVAPDTSFTIDGISGGVATVNFPTAFYADANAARLRQAQVVYALTQYPTVSQVAFQGPPGVARLSGARADYADLLPRIVVTRPAIGEQVTSPITVAGAADVHEATVSVRLLDAAGNELAATFTTAACRGSCPYPFTDHPHGNFSVPVGYRLAATQRGTVQVYSVSMADGSRTHLVDIPVQLAASTG